MILSNHFSSQKLECGRYVLRQVLRIREGNVVGALNRPVNPSDMHRVSC